MLSALLTSSSALDANQQFLNVVGNNLANSNTTGFKSQSVRFESQLSQLVQGASQPTTTNGGTNPIQVGNGVQVASTVTNLTQGSITPTGRNLDLAIQNNGYFILKKNGDTVYTRDGSLSIDSNNNLVNTSTGAIVQRVGAIGEATSTTPAFQIPGVNNINIPTSITIPGQATQNLSFVGNLSPGTQDPVSQVLSLVKPFTQSGSAATAATLLNNLDQTTAPYAAGDTIKITGTYPGGGAVSSLYTLTGTSSDTVGALLASINRAFQSQTTATGATATLDAAGKVNLTANTAGVSSLSLNLSSTGAGSTNFTGFATTTAGINGGTSVTESQIFDSQGVAHSLSFTFQKVSANQWNVTAGLNKGDGTITAFGQDNQVVGLNFNRNGSFNNVLGTNAAETLLTDRPFTAAGAPATGATLLNALDQHTSTPYASPDAIQISGVDFKGTPVSASLPVDGTTTVQDLVNSISTTYGGAVASIDPSGNIQLQAKFDGQTALSLKLSDASGNAGGLKFGNIIETARGTIGDDNITFQFNGLAGYGAPQTIKLSFGATGGFNGISQAGNSTGSSSVGIAQQDGYGTGSLISESISSTGVVNGQFSNGKTLAIAQIALATFDNPGSLLQVGGNLLQPTVNTGLPTISAPGVGGTGTIQSGSLESSNVDVSTEFTNLISAQRGYEINARAFTTANTMLQDTVDLIR